MLVENKQMLRCVPPKMTSVQVLYEQANMYSCTALPALLSNSMQSPFLANFLLSIWMDWMYMATNCVGYLLASASSYYHDIIYYIY